MPDLASQPTPPRRRVRPFPYNDLPRLLHSEVEGLRAVARHLFPLLDELAPSGLQRLTEIAGGSFAVRGYECYLIPALPSELSARAHGAVCVALERVGPANLRAALLIDESLCQRLEIAREAQSAAVIAREARSAAVIDQDDGPADAAALLPFLRELLAGGPVRVGPALAPGELAAHLQPTRGTAEATGGPLFCLDATLATARGGGWARLLCESRARFRVPPPPAPKRAPQRHALLASTTVTLTLEAGHGRLALADLLDLRSGDILLLDHFGPRPVVGGPIEVRVGTGAFPAHLDGSGVTLLGSFRSPFRREPPPPARSRSAPIDATPQGEDSPVSDSQSASKPPAPARAAAPSAQPAPAEAPPQTLLQEIPVLVTCEIGRVTMNGQEVLELRPGAVIPVGRPLAGPVDLRVGERLLARGELVDIEGELGVRLTEVLG